VEGAGEIVRRFREAAAEETRDARDGRDDRRETA
jgi:hypothetical protein